MLANGEWPRRRIVSSERKRPNAPRLALFLAGCVAVASFTFVAATNLASSARDQGFKRSGPAWPPNAVGRAYG
jgi:hypothetical protein